MKFLSVLIFLSLLAAASAGADSAQVLPAKSAASAPEAAKDWEKIGSDDGVDVYKKEIAGSPLIAFKGVGWVNSPLWKVFSVMADEKRGTEWVGALVAAVFAVLFTVMPRSESPALNPLVSATPEDLEMLADSDGVQLSREQDVDYDFYEWAVSEAKGGAASSVGT